MNSNVRHQMNDQTLQSRLSLGSALRSEGVVLAIIPFIGSLVALTYEAGYLSFFDVPATFVQLDFVRIVTASAVVAFFVVAYFIALVFAGFVVQGSNLLSHVLAFPLSVAFLLVPILLLTPGPPGRWLVLAGLMVLSILGDLIPPLFSRHSGTTYMQRLSANLESESPVHNDHKTKDSSTTLNKIIFPISVLFFVTFAIFALGRNAAAEVTTHWVTKDDQAWLLVRSYGGVFILKSFDPATKQIGSELRLLSPDNSAAATFIRKEIGKLLEPKQTSK